MAMMPLIASMRKIREVWASNLRQEFLTLLGLLQAAGPGCSIALDTEFPGVLEEGLWMSAKDVQYKGLRSSVELLKPIQLGLALAGSDGTVLAVFNFNLRFDLRQDLHTEASVNFLSAAGIDFSKHAKEGIDPKLLGSLLASSTLVAGSKDASDSNLQAPLPRWVTFAGLYDLGYLLKLLVDDPLPAHFEEFEGVLAAFCPVHTELRDRFPFGSLETLAKDHGVRRTGSAHTAGSDALLTLELHLKIELLTGVCAAPPGLEGLAGPQPVSGAPPGLEGLAGPQPVLGRPPVVYEALGGTTGGTTGDNTGSTDVVDAARRHTLWSRPVHGASSDRGADCGPAPSRTSVARAFQSPGAWGAAARWAMHANAREIAEAEENAPKQSAAPRAIWGAAARAAVVESRSSCGNSLVHRAAWTPVRS
eukprot:TRINITY_DN48307_c0_g1_i1.p1 TRINITY_DN48307_c0_g1~~TRINITY_DN48307_c0_g1_i1.p1  ORF type:complete len:420 (-),score=97.27 TRINITY_DN48307_c0_g1_i1:269-1528(-)